MSSSQWPQEDREWLVKLLKTETGKIHLELAAQNSRLDGVNLRLDGLERRQLESEVDRLQADNDMQSKLTDVALLRSAGAEAGKEAADSAGKKWVALATAIAIAVPPMLQQCQAFALPPSREKQTGAVQQPIAE